MPHALSLRRYKTILALGLPIIGGMISQSLLNLVDAALVGQLGDTALAAVGAGGYANFVIVSLVLGLSSSVQSLVARRQGQAQLSASPVNWGLALAFLVAVPLAVLSISFSDTLLALLNDDPAVLDTASQYFDFRVAALVAVAANLALRGWWHGTHRPAVYLKLLLAMHVLNVLVSYGLIFGHFGLPAMGAAGAGLGTAIALTTGAVLNFVLVWRDARPHGFLRTGCRQTSLRQLVKLAAPHSLQQFFFATATLLLFWIIGQLGTTEQAIAHVLINLALVLILPSVGLGMASTSLVSSALGRQQPDDAYRWGLNVVQVAFMLSSILSLPLWLMPDTVLSIFLHDARLIDQARLPLQLAALAICLDAAAIVLTQALLGAGANRTVMLVSTFGQWCFFLPMAWLAGPVLGFGLLGIWCVQLLYRCLSSMVFVQLWKQRRWSHIQL